MSSLSPAKLASAHEEFEAALPALHQQFRYALRGRRHDRDDLLAEAVGCAWKAWQGLVQRGRDPVVVGISGIASWAMRHALKGRRIGNRGGGRGSMDIFHRRAQKLGSFGIVSYDSGPSKRCETGGAAWKEWLCADHRNPADAAAFRVDFSAWLSELPDRRRRTAELLAEGRGTGEVAEAVGVTAAAVSQSRWWLARSYREFQGE